MQEKIKLKLAPADVTVFALQVTGGKKCHFLVPTILFFVVLDEQLLQSNKRLSLSALLPRGKPFFFSPIHV
jgi:hypothetical protein